MIVSALADVEPSTGLFRMWLDVHRLGSNVYEDPTGGTHRRVDFAQPNEGSSVFGLRFTPDGKTLIFQGFKQADFENAPSECDLYAVDVATLAVSVLFPEDCTVAMSATAPLRPGSDRRSPPPTADTSQATVMCGVIERLPKAKTNPIYQAHSLARPIEAAFLQEGVSLSPEHLHHTKGDRGDSLYCYSSRLGPEHDSYPLSQVQEQRWQSTGHRIHIARPCPMGHRGLGA